MTDRMSEHEYPLLDFVNRRNAAELARCGDDPFCAKALRTPTWAAPRYGFDVGTGFSRNLGYGDKISLGPVIPRSRIERRETGARFSRNGYNVCRPFDEAHMEDVSSSMPIDWRKRDRTFVSKRWVLSIMPLQEEFNYKGEKLGPKMKSEYDDAQFAEPPNHGHGAACKHSARSEFPCPWCHGIGHIICDDERAGRVSPSHAAGGYAEWQRRNPAAAFGVSGSGTYRVMPGTPLAEIYATQ